ncbi:MAG: FxDxF family PEP-CTERM protein [Sphingomicrobium sp.]
MRKFLVAAVAAAALAAGSTSANAANIITSINSTTLNSTGTSGPFGAVVNTTPFGDTFTFNLNLPSNTNGQIGTISLTGTRDINFSSIFIDTAANAFVKTSSDPNPEVWALMNPIVLTSGPHTLFVNGSLAAGIANASYSGTLNISPAAVPEPAAWALMLLGFGAIGMTMRRRQRPVLAQLA